MKIGILEGDDIGLEVVPECVKVMRAAIAFNGSYFNTQRMLCQYVKNAYADGDTRAGQTLD